MVELSFTLVPVLQRRLRGFVAADPWASGVQRHWNLNLYRTVPENIAVAAEWQAIKPGQAASSDPAGDPLPGGRPLSNNEAVGIEPAGGGPFRAIPRALQVAWSEGKIPDARLPDILAALEPRLRRQDFYTSNRRTGLWTGAIMAALMAAGCVLAALFLLPSQEHVSRYLENAMFLQAPAAERNVMLHGGLAVQPIAPIDAASLHSPPGLRMPPDLDTIGWYAAADGTRRLIVYTTRGSPQLRPDMVAYGPVIRAERIGLDTTRPASVAHADPVYVFIQHGGWQDSSDPSGFAHRPWMLPGFAALFALIGFALLGVLAGSKRRERSLRRVVDRVAGSQPTSQTG